MLARLLHKVVQDPPVAAPHAQRQRLHAVVRVRPAPAAQVHIDGNPVVLPAEELRLLRRGLVVGARAAVRLLGVAGVDQAAPDGVARGHAEDARVVPDLHVLEVALDPVEREVAARERSLHDED